MSSDPLGTRGRHRPRVPVKALLCPVPSFPPVVLRRVVENYYSGDGLKPPVGKRTKSEDPPKHGTSRVLVTTQNHGRVIHSYFFTEDLRCEWSTIS